jgi:hypothetical protein
MKLLESEKMAALEEKLFASFDIMLKELSVVDISRLRHVIASMDSSRIKSILVEITLEDSHLEMIESEEDANVALSESEAIDIVNDLLEPFIEPIIKPFFRSLVAKPYKISFLNIAFVEALKMDTDNRLSSEQRFLKLKYQADKLIAFLKSKNLVGLITSIKNDDKLQNTGNHALLFAFTLRQTAIADLYDFLDYNKTKYKGANYFQFLRGILNEEENLFSVGQTETINEWIIENKAPKAKIITEEPIEQDEDFGDNFSPIIGRLNKDEFAKFLSFLYRETNRDTEPFLSEAEVAKLVCNGLALPQEETKQYELKISAKKTLKTIYHCFYMLYDKHNQNRNCKDDIAAYLKFNFTNFKNIEIANIKDSMRSEKPSTMRFNIDNYFPQKTKSIAINR